MTVLIKKLYTHLLKPGVYRCYQYKRNTDGVVTAHLSQDGKSTLCGAIGTVRRNFGKLELTQYSWNCSLLKCLLCIRTIQQIEEYRKTQEEHLQAGSCFGAPIGTCEACEWASRTQEISVAEYQR